MEDHYHVADPNGNLIADKQGVTAFRDAVRACAVAEDMGVPIEDGLRTAVDRCELESCATSETWEPA